MGLRVQCDVEKGRLYNTVSFEGTNITATAFEGCLYYILRLFCLITTIQTTQGLTLNFFRFSVNKAFPGGGSSVDRIHAACAKAFRQKARNEWDSKKYSANVEAVTTSVFAALSRANEIEGSGSVYLGTLREFRDRVKQLDFSPYRNARPEPEVEIDEERFAWLDAEVFAEERREFNDALALYRQEEPRRKQDQLFKDSSLENEIDTLYYTALVIDGIRRKNKRFSEALQRINESIDAKFAALAAQGRALFTSCGDDLSKLQAAFAEADRIHGILSRSFRRTLFQPFYQATFREQVEFLAENAPTGNIDRAKLLDSIRAFKCRCDVEKQTITPVLQAELDKIHTNFHSWRDVGFISNPIIARLQGQFEPSLKGKVAEWREWHQLKAIETRIQALFDARAEFNVARISEQAAIRYVRELNYEKAREAFESAAKKSELIPQEAERLRKARALLDEMEKTYNAQKLSSLEQQFKEKEGALSELIAQVGRHPNSSVLIALQEYQTSVQIIAATKTYPFPADMGIESNDLKQLSERFARLNISGVLDFANRCFALEIAVKLLDDVNARREAYLNMAETEEEIDKLYSAGNFYAALIKMEGLERASRDNRNLFAAKLDVIDKLQKRSSVDFTKLPKDIANFFSIFDNVSEGHLKDLISQLRQGFNALLVVINKDSFSYEEVEKCLSEIKNTMNALRLYCGDQNIPYLPGRLERLRLFPSHSKSSRNYVLLEVQEWQRSSYQFSARLIEETARTWSTGIQKAQEAVAKMSGDLGQLSSIEHAARFFVDGFEVQKINAALEQASKMIHEALVKFRAGQMVDLRPIYAHLEFLWNLEQHLKPDLTKNLPHLSSWGYNPLEVLEDSLQEFHLGIPPVGIATVFEKMMAVIPEIHKRWNRIPMAFLLDYMPNQIVQALIGRSTPEKINKAITAVVPTLGQNLTWDNKISIVTDALTK